ncbi:MAG: adenosylmethionine--8-amino-7-oxononanoate transaminase [Candidatus Abyssobacteria bacterium SURF_17]|uniref:Adenosylmethionine-8-amino-7-oxononanoate aminotransferase n=1 Tax=Candidatus Abyssobacteria bacterium SURF_17 TaxID=2093361 RepID=A0A419EWZ4_9BACT|nr:MAG: adenosylmethionine--8-amino-7-oxononanoate transaminase [Candidatus Abyssubacteria bacterium SURF_17]
MSRRSHVRNDVEQFETDDRRYVWHPFTQMQDYEDERPLIIERAKGAYLYDVRGKRYLDGVSSLWVTVHGHRKRALDAAIRQQLSKVAHSTLLGISNVPAVKLARMLVERAPKGLAKVFYSDNGSTAVEVGLKMAFQYWQQHRSGLHKGRTKFVCFENAYHGDTIGSVGIGGIDLFHKMYRPLLMDAIRVPAPYCYRCPQSQRGDRPRVFESDNSGKQRSEHAKYGVCPHMVCLEEVERALEAHAHEVAALVIEPLVFAAGGIIVQPQGYLSRIRELCTRCGIFMIADEVAVGVGRTGTLFACEHEGVTPDILAVAKGLSGGYLPVAATLATQEIYDGFLGSYEEARALFHGHTYTGNPLACAAAVANLEIFDRERTLKKVQQKIEFLADLLQPLAELPHVGEVRQRGLMVGIELVKDKKSREPYEYGEKVGIKVIKEARRRGMIIRPLGNVIVLMPHLTLSRAQLVRMVDITRASIEAVTQT